MSGFLTLHKTGVFLCIKAKPGAKSLKSPRLVDLSEGKQALEVTVATVPEEGKANRAICAQLADWLGLKKKQLSLKAGQTGRIKIFLIEGDPTALEARIKTRLLSK